MYHFAQTAESIAGTSSKLKKIAFLAEYLGALNEADLRAAAVFFTGRPFPLTDARTLNVGWSALINAVQQISGASDDVIHQVYLAHGDLGELAEKLLGGAQTGNLSPAAVQSRLADLVKLSGASNKLPLVLDLFRSLSAVEAKYVIKIITGDLRIGLKENTVEEAIAKAFDRPAADIRRANMVLGDIGEAAILAKRGEMDQISLRMFRPVKFMLATPADTEDEIFATFPGAFYVEDKYDGIRGQLHLDPSRAALYSRTLDDVSHQFPEIVEGARNLTLSLIADGEIVAFKDNQVLPFSLLEERVELDPFFEQAALRRNEGLMLKDARSLYLPGKRGMSWLKWKKALATLDVVVTGVEFGHGRRRDVLSDYTFAVRDERKLLNIGKAYSGLTDVEIAEMTEFFKRHTIQDLGRFRLVEPIVVLEVAFNGIQKSGRHESGYALRFPRIVRIRHDKIASEVDTLETVEKIYNRHVG